MVCRNFKPNPRSSADFLEGEAEFKWFPAGVDRDRLEEILAADDAENWKPIQIDVHYPSADRQHFYEEWVNNYILRLTNGVAKPSSLKLPPMILEGLEGAERSARAARIQLFGEKFLVVVPLLQDFAKHADGRGMDIAVRFSQELKREPTVLNRMHLHLVSLWTSHHLWLMNDRDGSRYLEGLIKGGMSQEESKKVEVTEDAYEKAWRYKFRLSKPYKSLRFRIFTDDRVEIEDGEK